MEQLEEMVKEIGSKPGMCMDIIIDEVKRELLKKDSNAYNLWQSSNFDVNYVFYGKYNLLHIAYKHGIIELAKAVNEKGMEQLEEMVKEIGSKPGMCMNIIIDEVKRELLKKDSNAYNLWQSSNFDVNYVFYGKYNLLHIASKHGIIELAKALIEKGADVNAMDRYEN